MAFEWQMTLDEIDDIAAPRKVEGENQKRLVSDILMGDGSEPDRKASTSDDTDHEHDDLGILQTVTVYEIWDKRTKKVWFVTDRDKQVPLVVIDDPLGLNRFWPVPKILFAKRRLSSLQPISPWTVFKGLFEEFEDLCQRIRGITRQIRAIGIVPKELAADLEALKTLKDGELITATDITQYAQGGAGLEKMIAWWPLQALVVALEKATQQREACKGLIFEATGISDILRGNTDAGETATAQQIKASWGSQRVQDMQEDVAELCCEIINVKAELRQRLTPWEIVKEITDSTEWFAPELPPQPEQPDPAQLESSGDLNAAAQAMQQAQQAMQAWQEQVDQLTEQAQAFEEQVRELYQSRSSALKIDIETDSTVRRNLVHEQEQMNNLVQAMGSFAQSITAVVAIMPETRTAMFKLLAAMLGRFKLGRQGEAAIDELVEASKQLPRLADSQGADPAQMQHEQQQQQAQQEGEQAKQQHEMAKQESQQAHEQALAEHDAMTQQTALQTQALKDQHAQNQHERDLELATVQRAMPPQGGMESTQHINGHLGGRPGGFGGTA